MKHSNHLNLRKIFFMSQNMSVRLRGPDRGSYVAQVFIFQFSDSELGDWKSDLYSTNKAIFSLLSFLSSTYNAGTVSF